MECSPMRRLSLVAAVCCFVAIVLGCGGISGPVERRLSGNFGLAYRDSRDEMSVVELDGEGDEPSIKEWLIGGTIFAVGCDESHLIAKRHPGEMPLGPFDRSRTEYYIVTARDKKVYGPFDQAEYVLHCDLLGVAEGLDFTITFSDLE